MSAELLHGAPVAEEILAETRQKIARLGAVPHVVLICVGEDAASLSYVRSKAKKARELGMSAEVRTFPGTVSEAELLATVTELNVARDVKGILLQLPLPAGLDAGRILRSIDPLKDIDALHPDNVWALQNAAGGGNSPPLLPPTPAGILDLLRHHGISIAEKRAVVIGRSAIVGRPMAALLQAHGATVTVLHRQTPDLPSFTRTADLLVVAAGHPDLIGPEMLKKGAVVIDVGLSYTESGMKGDVQRAAREVAAAVTPVPRGVGPLTVAALMRNMAIAAELQALH